MIVPARGLLFLWLVVGVPLAAIAGIVPASRPPISGVAVLFAVVAVGDAWAGRRRIAGAEVRLDPVVRLTRGRRGVLGVRLRRAGGAPAPRVRLALAGGRIADWDPDELQIGWPREADDVVCSWPVEARERGRERVADARLEVPSPLGLWGVRRALDVECELRVYPELGESARRVAVRLWRRGAPGAHLARQIGRGREFDRLRDYVAGDPLDEIHWKATAKRGRPVSKVFRVERTQEVYVALDRSRLAGRLAGGEPALEAALRAALVLGLACRRFGDLFGVVAFSDKVERFVRAGGGHAHFNVCRDALFDGHARPVAPDFSELATFLRSRLRRRALVVVLTDLEDPVHAESFVRAARLVASRHLLLALGVRSEGVEPLFESPAADLGEVYSRLAGHRRWRKLEELRRVLLRLGVGFHVASAEGLVGEVVGRYVETKARQLL